MRRKKTFPEKVSSFERALVRESDRGCVLVAHAFLEERLGSILRQHFATASGSPPTSFDALLEDSLATFAPRARLAHAVGLISSSILETLLQLNKLRVHFAHHPGLVTLNTKVTMTIYGSLAEDARVDAEALGKYLYRWYAHAHFLKQPLPKHSKARREFVAVACYLLTDLGLHLPRT